MHDTVPPWQHAYVQYPRAMCSTARTIIAFRADQRRPKVPRVESCQRAYPSSVQYPRFKVLSSQGFRSVPVLKRISPHGRSLSKPPKTRDWLSCKTELHVRIEWQYGTAPPGHGYCNRKREINQNIIRKRAREGERESERERHT